MKPPAGGSRPENPKVQGDWPQWRGPNRDGIAGYLPERLDQAKRIWSYPLPNQGIGGIAAYEDFVVVSSRDRNDGMDVFSCLDATTGVAFWQHAYPAPGNLDYGNSPRATPLIHDPYVVTLGAFGDLRCLELESGNIVWKMHLIDDLEGQLPQWGYAASPIVVAGKLIVQPGGDRSSIAAIDLATGELLWRTPGRPAAYASLVEIERGNVCQVIGFDYRSLSAWDIENGKHLWEVQPAIKNDFNVPSPVLVPNGVVVTSENNATRLHRFDPQGQLERTPSAEFQEMAGDSHTPIRLGNFLVGIDRGLHVLDLDNGLSLMAQHADPALQGYCSLIGSLDRVLVTCEHGMLLLFRIDTHGITELGRLEVGKEPSQILAYPALSGSVYFVRVSDGVHAWELSGERTDATSR